MNDSKTLVPVVPRVRFQSQADFHRYMAGDMTAAVPTHIRKGDAMVPNPDYDTAPYEMHSVWNTPLLKP